MRPACQHTKFKADVSVVRLTEADKGVVTGYTSDIHVKCAQCGLPFRFLGFLAGSHPTQPRVSVDALELRAPLEPAYVPEILGRLDPSGRV